MTSKIKSTGCFCRGSGFNLQLITWQLITVAQVPGDQIVAWLIKTQRQILGFTLEVRKAKQPVTASSLYLSLIWQSRLQESQSETVSDSCLFIFLSRAGIKDVHHHCSASMGLTSVITGIKGVCHQCLVCKADQGGCFTL